MLDSWILDNHSIDLTDIIISEPITTTALDIVRQKERFRQAAQSMMSQEAKNLTRRVMKAKSDNEKKNAIEQLQTACNLYGARVYLI